MKPEILKRLGILYQTEDKFDASTESPGVHFSLGHDYWKMGRMDDSEEELRKGLRDDPHNPVGNYDLPAVLAAKQEYQEGIPLCGHR